MSMHFYQTKSIMMFDTFNSTTQFLYPENLHSKVFCAATPFLLILPGGLPLREVDGGPDTF